MLQIGVLYFPLAAVFGPGLVVLRDVCHHSEDIVVRKMEDRFQPLIK